MPYRYDVFISYKSGLVYGRWVQDTFCDYFKAYLDQSLGRDARIFLDRRGIRDGDDWKARIEAELAQSRCLVAVLSPLYFQSTWCRRECSVMFYREERLGYATVANPGGLVSPIIVHDGSRFPAKFRDRQSEQWQDYALVGGAFVNSPVFLQFQQELNRYAEGVAQMVERAPPFQDAWLTGEWLDDAFERYPLDLCNDIQQQPTL